MGVRETRIENEVVKLGESLGWIVHKMGMDGWPDRIVLKPGNRIFFVETKTWCGSVRKNQEFITKKLRETGYRVYFPRSIEAVVAMFKTERSIDANA